MKTNKSKERKEKRKKKEGGEEGRQGGRKEGRKEVSLKRERRESLNPTLKAIPNQSLSLAYSSFGLLLHFLFTPIFHIFPALPIYQ